MSKLSFGNLILILVFCIFFFFLYFFKAINILTKPSIARCWLVCIHHRRITFAITFTLSSFGIAFCFLSASSDSRWTHIALFVIVVASIRCELDACCNSESRNTITSFAASSGAKTWCHANDIIGFFFPLFFRIEVKLFSNGCKMLIFIACKWYEMKVWFVH